MFQQKLSAKSEFAKIEETLWRQAQLQTFNFFSRQKLLVILLPERINITEIFNTAFLANEERTFLYSKTFTNYVQEDTPIRKKDKTLLSKGDVGLSGRSSTVGQKEKCDCRKEVLGFLKVVVLSNHQRYLHATTEAVGNVLRQQFHKPGLQTVVRCVCHM